MSEEHSGPVNIEAEWDVDEETGLVFINCFWPERSEDEMLGDMFVSVTLPRHLSEKLIEIRKGEEGQEWPEGQNGPFDTICQYMADIVSSSGNLSTAFVHAMINHPLLGMLHHAIAVAGINGIKDQLGEQCDAYLEGMVMYKKEGERIKQFYRLMRGTPEENKGE